MKKLLEVINQSSKSNTRFIEDSIIEYNKIRWQRSTKEGISKEIFNFKFQPYYAFYQFILNIGKIITNIVYVHFEHQRKYNR